MSPVRWLVSVQLAVCFVAGATLGAAAQKKPAPAAKPAPPAPAKKAAPPVRDFTSMKMLKFPNLSLGEAKQLVESTALAIVYEFGYKEGAADRGEWLLASGTDLPTRRFFEKTTRAGRQTLEMGWRGLTRLGVHVVVAASGRGRSAKEALADYDKLLAKLAEGDKLLVAQQKKLGLRRFDMETLQLRYIKVDRALAMLKLLGYTVIEYKETKFRTASDGRTVLSKLFDPVQAKEVNLPVVARLIDAEQTWLKEKPKSRATGRLNVSVTPDIGGREMPEVTVADPQQRLVVIYDPADMASLYALKNCIMQTIDLPAQQIVIECMVIEVSENGLKELGLGFSRVELRSGGKIDLTFQDETVDGNTRRPLAFTFDDSASGPKVRTFKATLKALLRNGTAEILSKPSVLALNNRQARIRVGREIPILSNVITTRTSTLNIEYFPIGIVLNIKPRIGREDREVSMQIEAIVSSEDPEDKLTAADPNDTSKQIELAPFINTRIVQTQARVTNGTPFIIGGLVAKDKNEVEDRVPFISRIPLMGKLFSSRTSRSVRSEVIIVITPHIVPQNITNFSYIVPKDSDDFDTMGSRLFRSSYRLRTEDVFDLRFLYESDVFTGIRKRIEKAIELDPSLEDNPKIAAFTHERVPGEGVLVRRQLYEIIKRLELPEKIEARQIIFFNENEAKSTGFEIRFLAKELDAIEAGFFARSINRSSKVLTIVYDVSKRTEGTNLYSRPVGRVEVKSLGAWTDEKDRKQKVEKLLHGLNTPNQYAIVISSEDDIERLKTALIMKELIKINSPTEALRLSSFKVGRNLLFPSFPKSQRGERSKKFYLIDDSVAKCYYQTEFYYAAFRDQFNRAVEEANAVVNQALGGGDKPEPAHE